MAHRLFLKSVPSWWRWPSSKPWPAREVTVTDRYLIEYINDQVAAIHHRNSRNRLCVELKIGRWISQILAPKNHVVAPALAGFLRLCMGSIAGIVRFRAAALSATDLSRVSLALAEYRSKHGRYPKSLKALVPRYIKALPRDPFVGIPLGYSLRRTQCRVWTLARFVNLNSPPPPAGVDLRDIVRLSIPPGHFVWPKIAGASG